MVALWRMGGGGCQVALGSNPSSVAHLFSKPIREDDLLQLWTSPCGSQAENTMSLLRQDGLAGVWD